MKKIARVRAHRELLGNSLKAKKELFSGIVEDFNNKAKVTMRESYGFRIFASLNSRSTTRLASCLSWN